jgi:2',3'-cyclic-nucleotide 2'-phosphodiesterase (5'-nucleotidase family)
LARPGIVASTQLRRAGRDVRAAPSAAGAALADLQGKDRVDVTIALVNGGRDSQEDQATALVEGLPVRSGLSEWTGGIPVDLVIARAGGRQRASPTAVAVDAVPTIRVAPGLTVLHVSLTSDAGRWRVRDVARQTVAADPNPDPEILALAGEAWNRLAPWLAQPTRAVVSGYNRKADFMACAGELSHAAVVAAVGSQGGAGVGAAYAPGAANAGPPLTLTPQLWRFEPLRKPQRGQAITRAQLYRWMPYDDAILPAQLTGRQIALLLEPYARYRSAWSVTPSWVLHPGGMEPVIPGRATQPSGLAFAATGAALERQARYPVWMPAYHAYGAGGLARRALVQPDQLGKPLHPPLRELVFQWMAGPAFTVPAACAGFLALVPPR